MLPIEAGVGATRLGQSGDYPSRRKTWTCTGKKSPGQTGGTGQGSEAPRLQPLPPTSDGGIGASGWVTSAPSATFVEQSFLDQPRVQKNALCEQRESRSSARRMGKTSSASGEVFGRP